ncbi:MAG: DUF2314 domain-containing protein [Planctomycetaceae bacterium]
MPRIRSLLPIVVLLGFGCGDDDGLDTVARPGNPDVVNVDDENELMNAAIAKAQSTVDEFIAALNAPKSNQTGFSVKYPLTVDGGAEHIWVSDVRYENETFVGVLGNVPVNATAVKLGDEVTIPKGDVSDWMYLEEGRLVGGYTIRALREIMPAEQRAEFDKNAPFVID